MITITMVRITRVTEDRTNSHRSFQRHSKRYPALAFTPDEDYRKVELWAKVVRASVAHLLRSMGLMSSHEEER